MASTNRMAHFTLTGTSPLLMHADDVGAIAALSAWRKNPANESANAPGDDRSPPWTWQTYLHRDDGGNVAMPTVYVMAALRQAGARMILSRHATFKEIARTGLLIDGQMLSFTSRGKAVNMAEFDENRDESFEEQAARVRAAGFSILTRRAAVGTWKFVRVRPKFEDWSVTGTIRMLAPELTLESLTTLFDLAGQFGLCDWRPGCRTPGRYGMFESSVREA